MRHHPRARLAAVLSATVLPLALATALALVPAAAADAPETSGSSTTPSSAGSSSAVPAPSASSKKATFGLQPASHGKPDSRGQLSYQSTPGGSFSDSVALLNFSPFPLDLQVYLANLSNGSDGSLVVAAQGARTADAATWANLDNVPQSVHVEAATATAPAQVLFPLTLRVPVTASPGDHVAAMVASLETVGKNPKGENVKLLQRVALRIFVRVNGQIRQHYVVEKPALSYHGTTNPFAPGSADLSYTIRNDGNVSLGVSQKVTVSGWFGGTGAAPKLLDIPVLLPDSSVRVRAHIKDVWPEIHLTGEVTLTSLRSGTSTDTLLAPVSASASAWAIPWGVLILLVVIVGLGFGARQWARSGRRSYSGRRRNK